MATFGKIGAKDILWKPPYDKEVEYLQNPAANTPNAYISIPGLYPVAQLSTEIKVSMAYSSIYSSFMLFGFANDYAGNPRRTYVLGARSIRRLTRLYGIVSDGNVNYLDTTVGVDISSQPDNTPITIAFNAVDNTFNFNGTIIKNTRRLTYTTDTRGTWPMRLFQIVISNGKQVGTTYCASQYDSFRIYSAKFKMYDEVIHDFIPVRCGSVGYMFDRANIKGEPLGNGLYPNGGTVPFVLGPDKVVRGGGKCIESSESAFYSYSSDSFWKEAA